MFKTVYELKISRATEGMLERIRRIVRCHTGNDPDECIIDDGVSMTFKGDLIEFINVKKSLIKYAKTLPVGVVIDIDRF